MRKKLNRNLSTAPAGAVLTLAWLVDHRISRKLADRYARSGWLHRVGPGAFTVHPGPPTWSGAVFGLQQTSKSIHLGGRTALEFAGFAHFLPLGDDYPLFLFGPTGECLPRWFKGLPCFKRIRHVKTNVLPYNLGIGEHCDGELVVRISLPERAILELIQASGFSTFSYQHADLIFESLDTLHADLVQRLLQVCASVTVKRLFLHLAERHNHPWVKALDLSKVSLGTGKRTLISGGRLDPKYLVTVPEEAQWGRDAP